MNLLQTYFSAKNTSKTVLYQPQTPAVSRKNTAKHTNSTKYRKTLEISTKTYHTPIHTYPTPQKTPNQYYTNPKHLKKAKNSKTHKSAQNNTQNSNKSRKPHSKTHQNLLQTYYTPTTQRNRPNCVLYQPQATQKT